jgi:hypothetical protein
LLSQAFHLPRKGLFITFRSILQYLFTFSQAAPRSAAKKSIYDDILPSVLKRDMQPCDKALLDLKLE